MVDTLITIFIGVFLGWVVIPQPAWAETVWTFAKNKVKSWTNK